MKLQSSKFIFCRLLISSVNYIPKKIVYCSKRFMPPQVSSLSINEAQHTFFTLPKKKTKNRILLTKLTCCPAGKTEDKRLHTEKTKLKTTLHPKSGCSRLFGQARSSNLRWCRFLLPGKLSWWRITAPPECGLTDVIDADEETVL